MVREALLLVDRLLDRRGSDARRGDLVVDAPADVLRPGLAAVRPPGVLVGLAVDAPENVDEADLVEDVRQPGALLRQEARVLLIRFPVPEVDLLVRDVPVAAQDDFLFPVLQFLQVQDEMLEKPEFGRLAVRPRRAGGQIDRDYPELAEARLDVASFRIELARLEAALHLVRRPAAIERDAAVALLLRKSVAGLIELQAVQLRVEIRLLAFHLLQADDVGTLRGEPAEQALFRRRPHAVDVEGDDAQRTI